MSSQTLRAVRQAVERLRHRGAFILGQGVELILRNESITAV